MDLGTKEYKWPSIEQWSEVYNIAAQIKKLSPWDHLWESNIFVIMLPNYEEPIYCSIMGRAGQCYAIGVYAGYESIRGFYRLSEATEKHNAVVTGFEQDCLMCFYGNREEVTKEDRQVFEKLNLKFRGRNAWIYFRAMDPGYLPWFIEHEQCDLLIQVLGNLEIALAAYINGEVKVDFDNNQLFCRSYSHEDESWHNKAIEALPIPEEGLPIVAENELLLAQMRKQKNTGLQIEIEATYLPTPIQEDKVLRPYIPQLLLMVDKENGLVVAQHLLNKGDDLSTELQVFLAFYVGEVGRPYSVNVRDRYVGRHLEDLCKKTGIKLIEGEGVPGVDDMMRDLISVVDMMF